jgi:adenylosuccinate synthase
VGEGPFPTELFDEMGKTIQQKGFEFGATTGRTRRCGWLDLPLLKYTVKASNLTSLALTKLDILSGLGTLKACVGYKLGDRTFDCAYPGLDLARVEPIMKEFKPFDDAFKGGELSVELKAFIQAIEAHVGVPVGIIAFGPERSEIHFLKNYF